MSFGARAVSPEPGVTASAAADLGKTAKLILVLIIALAAALRFAAMFNDLWMDEIWSIKLVGAFRSPLQVFTQYFQANNHPLSSLWLYALVPAHADWTYRLLSWMTGTASVILGALIARDQFRRLNPTLPVNQVRVATLAAATLLSACYFLILYSSEARGYAPALAFCLLGFYALQRTPDLSPGGWMLVYWIASALALLSHAASIQIIGAAFVWSLVQIVQSPTARRRIAGLVLWHSVPFACSVAYYALFLRRVNVGGAPELTLRQVMGELAAYTCGFPSPAIAWFALPVIAGLTLLALGYMWRRARADAVFFGLIIFSAPATGLVAAPLGVLFPRYFIFSAAWLLLLVAYAIAISWNRRPALRNACIVGVALFAAGNSVHIVSLLRHGRGEYQAALRYIAEHTRTPDITICSDHDNRNFMLIDYYAARSAPGRRVIYVLGNRTSEVRPQWLLVHRLDGLPPPDATLYDDRGNTFKLEKKFPHAPLSGWDWFVFRNAREAPEPQLIPAPQKG
jgi:hypothetical protein